MCPIVPTFTCGFFRSYFAFAMRPTSRWGSRLRDSRWSPCPGLNRRPRPYQGRALPTELHGRSDIVWSGKRDSNPRPPAWKAGALPLSYSRACLSPSRRDSRWWGGEDLNPRRRTPADLQSAPFGHLGTSPHPPACDGNPLKSWRWREDLNPRPTAYKAVALPLSYASTDKVPNYCRDPDKSSTLMALAGNLVAQDRRGGRDVEGVRSTGHRNGQHGVAGAGDEGP